MNEIIILIEAELPKRFTSVDVQKLFRSHNIPHYNPQHILKALQLRGHLRYLGAGRFQRN